MTTLSPDIPTTTETHESGGALTLTAGQQAALEGFFSFLCNPLERAWKLGGYSGCGKSTLIRTVIDQLPMFMQTARLLDTSFPHYAMELTATTNKAAENLGFITGMGVRTIHSLLGLRVQTDYSTGKTTLIPKSKDPVVFNTILFIDEASYIDGPLLDHIFKLTKDCKIVFILDPAQLTAVNAVGVPVANAPFPGAELTEVVRQKQDPNAPLHPIVEMSTQFRHIVKSGDWSTFTFRPDGTHVLHLDRDAFNDAVLKEFTRTNWRYRDSKLLAWTNKRVIEYNQFINKNAKGDPHFQVDDYAVCNSFVAANRTSLKTDQLVQITNISAPTEQYGVIGKMFEIDGNAKFFMPDSLEAKNARMKEAKALDDQLVMSVIDQQWIDLRQAFSQTINKSQGSTYDKVFVDLDDIRRCNNGETIARMLYVGTSRARHQVFLTGDLA